MVGAVFVSSLLIVSVEPSTVFMAKYELFGASLMSLLFTVIVPPLIVPLPAKLIAVNLLSIAPPVMAKVAEASTLISALPKVSVDAM